MDETAVHYYTSIVTRLLFLLSAFLTAMVGIGTPAAAVVRPACEVAATTSVCTERKAPCTALVAIHKIQSLDRVNFGAIAVRSAPALTIPLYAGRLRV